MNHAAISQRWHAGAAALRRAGSPPPPLSRWAWAADVAIAIVLAAGTLRFTHASGGTHPFGLVPAPPKPPQLPGANTSTDQLLSGDAILAVLTALPLAVRRRYPLTAFWAVLLAMLLFHVRVHDNDAATFTFASCLVAAYTAATYSPYRARTLTSLIAGAALLGAWHDATVPDVTAGYVPFLVVLGIAMAANTVHVWKQRVAALEHGREEATRQAVERERARIARELHDVVTHNVAVMVVQAGAARKVIDVAPGQAREALLAVEAGGRAALTELRHVMGLLTMSSDPPQLAPQPGLDQLATLAGGVRDAGVPVELSITGEAEPLTPGVDLTAYRVVQEALTNILKHAAGARVRIAVDYRPEAVHIEVADTGGTPTPDAASGNGHGLDGLRERLGVYGGTLQAGALPVGGYRVRAIIPIEAAASTPS